MPYQLTLEDHFLLANHYCEEGDMIGALRVHDRIFESIGMKMDYRCKSEYTKSSAILANGLEVPKCVCTKYSGHNGRNVSLSLSYHYLDPTELEKGLEKGLEQDKEISKKATIAGNEMFCGRPLSKEEKQLLEEQIDRHFGQLRSEYLGKLHNYRPHIHTITLFSGTWSYASGDDLMLIPGSRQSEEINMYFTESIKCDKMFNNFVFDQSNIPIHPSNPAVFILKMLFENENRK